MRPRHSQGEPVYPEGSSDPRTMQEEAGGPLPVRTGKDSFFCGREGMPLALPCALSLPTSTPTVPLGLGLEATSRAGLGATSGSHRLPLGCPPPPLPCSPFITLIIPCGPFFCLFLGFVLFVFGVFLFFFFYIFPCVSPRTTVSKLFGTRGRFCGRQFFQEGDGGRGDGEQEVELGW